MATPFATMRFSEDAGAREETMAGRNRGASARGSDPWPTSEDSCALTTNAEAAARCGRDVGPMSTRNTSKGALITEAQAVLRSMAPGTPVENLRRACLTGSILRQRTRETRRHIWDLLHWRLFIWRPPQWVLVDLAEAARGYSADPRFAGLLFLHYARRDRLTFEFVTEKLWALWKSRNLEVSRNDVLDYLQSSKPHNPQIKEWRESSRKKLAGNVLSALRDFGLLKGVQRKLIQQPLLPLEVVLHLCRLLHGEGLRGRAVLEARDWRLFLREPHEIAAAFGQLAQRGQLRFERSGKTVVLEVPEQAGRDER